MKRRNLLTGLASAAAALTFASGLGAQQGAAIALMSSPIFFQETQLLGAAARDQIRPLLALYKKHRQAINDDYVFPIGGQPSDASWAGFQTFHPDRRGGYLLLFREQGAKESEKTMRLKFMGDAELVLEDLVRSTTARVKADAGSVRFKLDQPASFAFYRYRVEGG